MAVGYATGGRTPCDPRHKSKNASQGRSQSRNLERSCSLARRGRGTSAGSFDLFGARKRHSVQASAGGRKFHRVVPEIGKSRLRRADGANAYTRWTDWHTDRCSPNRSIVMPPSIVIPAMPVKGIIDPTRVRTVWRSPKRVSPHGTDHAADDCSRRPGDDKSSSGAESRADCVRSRTRRRNRHQRDGRAC